MTPSENSTNSQDPEALKDTEPVEEIAQPVEAQPEPPAAIVPAHEPAGEHQEEIAQPADAQSEPTAASAPPDEPASEYLEKGSKLSGRDDYIIDKYLGEGVTAIVYSAKNQRTGDSVALKVLRQNASPTTQDYFWFESEITAELIKNGIDCVPKKLDEQRSTPPKFLAMELIDSQYYEPLDERLKRGAVVEEVVLEIAAQALDLLDRLHHQVGRTYTDMQLKDFCWESKNQKLIVMDWNHVSPLKAWVDEIPKMENEEARQNRLAELAKFNARNFNDLMRNDLARFASYLFQLLTEKGASPAGELPSKLASTAGEQWDGISLATRRLLEKALNPNPDLRFVKCTTIEGEALGETCEPSAAEFLLAVKDVQQLWHMDADQGETIGEEIEEAISKADDIMKAARSFGRQPDGLSELNLDRRAIELDMLERKNLWFPVARRRARDAFNDLIKVKGATDLFTRGQGQYNAHLYLDAFDTWRREAQNQGSLEVWRWALLAKAGSEDVTLFGKENETKRDTLDAAVKAMNADEFQAARELFNSLSELSGEKSTGSALDILTDENALHLKDAEARLDAESDTPESWEKAAVAYLQISTWLADVDGDWREYRDLLVVKYGWKDAAERAELLQHRASEVKQATQHLNQIRKDLEGQGTFAAGLAGLQKALKMDGKNRQLLQLCLDFSLSNRATKAEAVQVLEAGYYLGGLPDMKTRLGEALQVERLASRIEDALQRRSWSKLDDLSSDPGLSAEVKAGPAFQELKHELSSTFDEQAKFHNLIALRALNNAINAIDPDQAEERQAKIEEVQKKLEEEQAVINSSEIQQKNLQRQAFWSAANQWQLGFVEKRGQVAPEQTAELAKEVDAWLDSIRGNEQYQLILEEAEIKSWLAAVKQQADDLREYQAAYEQGVQGIEHVKTSLSQAESSIKALTEQGLSDADEELKKATATLEPIKLVTLQAEKQKLAHQVDLDRLLIASIRDTALLQNLQAVSTSLNSARQTADPDKKSVFLHDANDNLTAAWHSVGIAIRAKPGLADRAELLTPRLYNLNNEITTENRFLEQYRPLFDTLPRLVIVGAATPSETGLPDSSQESEEPPTEPPSGATPKPGDSTPPKEPDEDKPKGTDQRWKIVALTAIVIAVLLLALLGFLALSGRIKPNSSAQQAPEPTQVVQVVTETVIEATTPLVVETVVSTVVVESTEEPTLEPTSPTEDPAALTPTVTATTPLAMQFSIVPTYTLYTEVGAKQLISPTLKQIGDISAQQVITTTWFDLPTLQLTLSSDADSFVITDTQVQDKPARKLLVNHEGSRIPLQIAIYELDADNKRKDPLIMEAAPVITNTFGIEVKDNLTALWYPDASQSPLLHGKYEIEVQNAKTQEMIEGTQALSLDVTWQGQTKLRVTNDEIVSKQWPDEAVAPATVAAEVATGDVFDVLGKILRINTEDKFWLVLRKPGTRLIYFGYYYFYPGYFIQPDNGEQIDIKTIPVYQAS